LKNDNTKVYFIIFFAFVKAFFAFCLFTLNRAKNIDKFNSFILLSEFFL